MPRHRVAVLPLLVLLPGAPALQAGAITPAGEHLARVLDGMDVEHLWLPGHAVHWRTGKRDPHGRQRATHCSTFVAAACARLGVYILRPPAHSQVLLANAQRRWLETKGKRRGWWRVRTDREAQDLANKGYLVVVSFQNPNRKKPGHIAIVRPSTRGARLLAEEGPAIIQAGRINRQSTSLAVGFKSHLGAWKRGELRYYAHEVPRPARR
jgi:hypothetical protein